MKMAEKQHFIPKVILRGFTDSLTPAQQEPYLWIYYFAKNIWNNKAPQNIAFKNNFYNYIDNNAIENKEIEKFLSYVEGRTGVILKERIFKKVPLGANERIIISYFLGFILLRGVRFRSGLTKVLEKGFEQVRMSEPDKYEKYGKVLETIFKNEEMQKFWSLKLMMNKSETAASIIFQMTWIFYNATEKQRFIISDNPLSLLSGYTLLDKNAKLVFPFSKEVCLVASW